ncbi:hypothetical protein [Psychromonas arctica]|uniref:hypothetical protein n=1 Tax=Psychromonas arctica TaxID=168275 RepID=UPI002FD6B996
MTQPRQSQVSFLDPIIIFSRSVHGVYSSSEGKYIEALFEYIGEKPPECRVSGLI